MKNDKTKRVATVSALVTVGFSFDDEPTVNSNGELTVAAIWRGKPAATGLAITGNVSEIVHAKNGDFGGAWAEE